jgi:hypothetical protein
MTTRGRTTWQRVGATVGAVIALLGASTVVPRGAAPGAIAPVAMSRAEAQDPVHVSAQVMVIVAREIAGAIDPRLGTLTALRRPPFSSFGSMDIFAEHSVTLPLGTPVTIDLPNGRVMQLVLEEITPDGRNHVRVSINRRSQSDYLPVLEVAAPAGEPFFVAGQSFMGGTLVIGVNLGPRGSSASAPRTPPATPPATAAH